MDFLIIITIYGKDADAVEYFAVNFMAFSCILLFLSSLLHILCSYQVFVSVVTNSSPGLARDSRCDSLSEIAWHPMRDVEINYKGKTDWATELE